MRRSVVALTRVVATVRRFGRVLTRLPPTGDVPRSCCFVAGCPLRSRRRSARHAVSTAQSVTRRLRDATAASGLPSGWDADAAITAHTADAHHNVVMGWLWATFWFASPGFCYVTCLLLRAFFTALHTAHTTTATRPHTPRTPRAARTRAARTHHAHAHAHYRAPHTALRALCLRAPPRCRCYAPLRTPHARTRCTFTHLPHTTTPVTLLRSLYATYAAPAPRHARTAVPTLTHRAAALPTLPRGCPAMPSRSCAHPPRTLCPALHARRVPLLLRCAGGH